ncbi:MAG: aldo/keto reductase [Planctomycetes bacterium]|nr:aldo/keto reductase [Planctomycetota bacterium]NOG53005.1 aldo/keto reductase [Planctomycetota bacterium]
MTTHNQQSRRDFLRISAGSIAGGLFARTLSASVMTAAQQDADAAAAARTIPQILLGRTGRTVPRLGFGGFPIVRLNEEDAVGVLNKALEYGVRYFDTAPSYGNGKSETYIGTALKASGLAREDLFVATKTLERSADGARRELEQSLKRLQLDYVDTLQIHAVHDDVDTVFGDTAVYSGLLKLRDEGLIRHLGITGHVSPLYLNDAITREQFDTALVPINPIDTKHQSFVKHFLPVAVERGVAVIAMKVYAGGSLFQIPGLKASELLRYALTQSGVAVAVPGCQAVSHVDEAHEGAMTNPLDLTEQEQADLVERCGPHQGKTSEWYKEASPYQEPEHGAGGG